MDNGLHFCRINLRKDLPVDNEPELSNDNYDVTLLGAASTNLHGYADADWASDSQTRWSMSGIRLFLASAPVAYTARYQPTIGLSSTESKFVGASNAGKLALYLRSVLNQLGLDTNEATPLYEDNAAAIKMANAQQPTR